MDSHGFQTDLTKPNFIGSRSYNSDSHDLQRHIMEPQYMILGHAAGIAAALAISSNAAVQDVSIADLQSRLRDQGAVFELGHDFQQQGLAAIRKRYAPPPRKGPVPWGYPEKR